MSQIVKSFNQWQLRKKPDVLDSLEVDGSRVSFKAADIRGGKPMPDPKSSISINKGAVQGLALYGPQDQVEALYRETFQTTKRLGLEGGKAFRKPARFQGGRPSIHDIIPWLNSLMAKSPEEELVFLKRLHTTVRNRTREDVIARVEG